MTQGAITFLTYLWHYLVGRLVYDQLVRPVIHGHVSIAPLTCAVGAGAFLLGRWTAKPRGRA
jgi:hypothetical protein